MANTRQQNAREGMDNAPACMSPTSYMFFRPLKATRLFAFLSLVPTVFKELCLVALGVGAGVWTEDACVQVWPCTSW